MPDLQAVFALVEGRQFGEAQAALDACAGRGDSPAWWQMQGLVYSVQGQTEQAIQALTHGLTWSASDLRTAGRLHFELGVLFGKEGRRSEALEAYLQSKVLLRQKPDAPRTLALAHNLSWSLLEFNRPQEAAACLDEVVLTSVRTRGRSYHSLVQCGRSLVARLQGDQQLALSRAELALETAPDAFVEARACYLAGQAHWRLGDLDAAVHTFSQARSLTPEGPSVSLIDLTLGLLDQQVPQDESGFTAQQRARIRFHQAAWALRRGAESEAAHRLEEALSGLSAYEVRSESSLLPDLVRWARGRGYDLPALPAPPTRVIVVRVRNPLELCINGHQVDTRVPGEVAALVAGLLRLLESGAVSERILAQHALGERAHRLEAAFEQLKALVGDLNAVVSPPGEKGRWRLSPAWNWVMDGSGRGTVLGGIVSSLSAHLEVESPEARSAPAPVRSMGR